jgi:hypothetical protein
VRYADAGHYVLEDVGADARSRIRNYLSPSASGP